MTENRNILLFIPAQNEEKTIASVISGSILAIERLCSKKPDVLVIDDGSTDKTQLVAEKSGAHVIAWGQKRGLGTIFAQAVEYALTGKYDVLVTIDGDGQFSTEDIPKLLEPILEDKADFVTGSRFLPESTVRGIPGSKKNGNRLMSTLIGSILGKKFYDVSCGFRAYGREALLHLNLFGSFTYTQEVFLNLGYKGLRIKEVPINVQYFKERSRASPEAFYDTLSKHQR